jgi:hypothetical protein
MASTSTATKTTTKSRAKAAKPNTNAYLEPPKATPNIDFANHTQEYWVPLEWVYPKPSQQRSKFKQSGINELILSFEENGQQTAIEVMHQLLTPEMMEEASWEDNVIEDDEPPVRGRRRALRKDVISIPEDWSTGVVPCLMVKTGETRHRARVQSGKFNFIRVVMRPLIDGVDLAVQHGIENLNRSGLSPMDEARYYHELHTVYGLSIDEIAVKLGISQAQKFRITWRLKLNKLSPKWMEIVDQKYFYVDHKGSKKKIDVGEDPLRIAAEICDHDPISGKEIPRHDLMDMLLAQIISHAARTGKLMEGNMMKRIRDGMAAPQAAQDSLEMILPKTDLTEKAIAELQDGLTASWKKLGALLLSQGEGNPTRCLEYLGEVQGQGLSQIAEQIEKKAGTLKKLINEQLATNFARKARTAADASREPELSLDEVLAQIDKGE